MGYDNQSFGLNFNLEKHVFSMLFHKTEIVELYHISHRMPKSVFSTNMFSELREEV